MGHGVKASLVTTLLRGLLAEVSARPLAPGQVLANINERLCTLLDYPSFPRFVTAVYATVDLSEGQLALASAAHPWPLLSRKGERCRGLGSVECGPALGLIAAAQYDTVCLKLRREDRVLLYTDGLKEEQNWSGEEFGTERLGVLLSEAPDLSPDEILDDLVSQVRLFSGAGATSDDLCAVLLAF